MEQPYIFKKQIVSVVVLLLCVVFLELKSIQLALREVVELYFFVVLFITFVPSVRKRYSYSLYIHLAIYYLPLILPVLLPLNWSVKTSVLDAVYGVVVGLVLLAFKYKDVFKAISSDNVMSKSPLSFKELLLDLYHNILAVVAEEVFFRMVIIGFLAGEFGVVSVLISSLLFLHSRYINRWANVMFNFKSYVYHLVLGLCLGLLYYYSKSLMLVMIAHLIFNSPDMAVSILRYRTRDRDNGYGLGGY